MIEIYLFINPLGGHCLQTERTLLNLISKENKKIQFRFVPYLNLRVVQSLLEERSLPNDDIQLRNKLFEDIYSASLDYKAVQLQGKKIGRAFLLSIQEAVGLNCLPYTPELVTDIVQEIGADLEMFQVDRISELVKKSFDDDQITAHEMGISKHSSAVFFNYACERDYGVLVEDGQFSSNFHTLCQTDTDSCELNYGGLHNKYNHQRIHRDYLHLLEN